GPLRVGVVGLGAGTLAAYGRTGDVFRFYDINSDVVELARSEFTFLKDSRAKVEVALGDARLSLEREPAQNFDVLALDAFSSDAIPVHLLTVEAFKTYLRHLKPDGVLAVHISNRYLDLVPVVQQAARHLSLEVRSEEHTSELQSPCNLVCRLLLEKKKIQHLRNLRYEQLTFSKLRHHVASITSSQLFLSLSLHTLLRLIIVLIPCRIVIRCIPHLY